MYSYIDGRCIIIIIHYYYYTLYITLVKIVPCFSPASIYTSSFVYILSFFSPLDTVTRYAEISLLDLKF